MQSVSAIERRTMAKVYLRLLPFCFVLYFICYLDRVNIGFAALTMNKELGLSSYVFGFGERQLAAKSSGCTFANQAAEKIDKEIPLAATATENALLALLAGTKARLTSLNGENKSFG
jgi:hypothetical protein